MANELDTVRVIHAVVLRASALPQAQAVAVAAAVLHAVAGAHDEDEFDTKATAVPHPGAQLVVQRLSGFDVSGANANGEKLDPSFVAAAFALRSRGETSGLVHTPFGWHVIRLIDRTAPEGASLERRRAELSQAAFTARVRMRVDGMLRAQRDRVAVEISTAAEQLTAGAEKMP